MRDAGDVAHDVDAPVLARGPVDQRIDKIIREIVPDLTRVSSGFSQGALEETLLSFNIQARVVDIEMGDGFVALVFV